jgi:site-specific DNA-methyltransferase (adenine-specific)
LEKRSRSRTKTSSFGTSKREGHDASQFYGSNLYQGVLIDEKQFELDRSAEISPSIYESPVNLEQLPDNSVHLAIIDLLSVDSKPDLSLEQICSRVDKVLSKLVTGGKLLLLVKNERCIDTQAVKFIPVHQQLVMHVLKRHLFMRGEILWLPSEIPPCSGIHPAYLRILVFSAGKLTRKRTTQAGPKTDTITRDLFLACTKSLWRSNPSLFDSLHPIQDEKSELIARLLHFYSFREDTVLIMAPEIEAERVKFMRKIRTRTISVIGDGF